MSVKLNSSGASHASSLVKSGKVTKSTSWSAPSADKENAYIKKNGISEYGKWFMGADTAEDKENKGHYKYPFSNDFSTVNLKGLKAIKSRAAQQGAKEIESRADSLINKIEKNAKASIEVVASKRGLTFIVDFEKEVD